MKQKIVIKVSMNAEKSRSRTLLSAVGFSGLSSRSKALQISVCFHGVEQAAFGGTEKDQIEVTGDGIDAIQLTKSLRKKVGFAEIISITPVGGENKEEKEEPKVTPMIWSYGVPNYPIYEMTGNIARYHDPYACYIL